MDYKEIYKEYEKTKDVCKFYKKYDYDRLSERFLLVRSLDNKNLDELFHKITGRSLASFSHADKCKELLETNISVTSLVQFIRSKRQELISKRKRENDGLDTLVKDFANIKCGIRNDKIDDIIKKFVRDKTIKEYSVFKERLEIDIIEKVRNYVEWSFFNQTTNDIIELFFLDNSNIIPTLRKIHDIDFFIEIDERIIPFDLKITHISDDFFDLYQKGILPSKSFDLYEIGKGESEIQIIKDFYKENKKLYNLPPYGGLTKREIIAILEQIQTPLFASFLQYIADNREAMVYKLISDTKKIEWWNYKFQGERLFSNNNRIFIFLAYSDSFNDAKLLKIKLTEIEQSINKIIKNILDNKINKICYVYEKEEDLNGEYEAFSVSELIIGKEYVNE